MLIFVFEKNKGVLSDWIVSFERPLVMVVILTV